MKNFKPLLLLLLCIIISSCQVDNEILDNNDSESIEQKRFSGVTGSSEPQVGSPEFFEGVLQWVSFITAETIINDDAAKQEFVNALNGGDAIKLEDLLDNDNTSTAHFYSSFRDIYAIYYKPGRPETSLPTNPGSTVVGPGILPTVPVTDVEAISLGFDDFVNYLLKDNCVEMYLPNGGLTRLNTGTGIIASTAHPLATRNHNYGYERNNNSIVELPVVNIFYSRTLVVARPFRTTWPGAPAQCAYSEYNNIPSFNSFLD